MIDYSDQVTSTWVFEYLTGFDTYMWKYHPVPYAKVHLKYVIPPQKIGGAIGIKKTKKLFESDYHELVKITDDFCDKYPDPKYFPAAW